MSQNTTKTSSIRLGFFARADNGGLGAESWEFARQMRPDKIMVIRGEHGHHPERFDGLNCTFVDGIPTHGDLDLFLRDIDVLFSIETFYNWGVVEMARSRGIKTVLRVNYEMNLNQVDPHCPVADFFTVPSMWHYNDIPFANKKYLPFPVNRDVFPFKRRNEISNFYYIAGHHGYEDRNGIQVMLQAIPHIKTQPNIKIFSQLPLDFDFAAYPFVELINRDFENYWEVHQGDCLISPRRYGGQSLPLNEALSLGIPVIMPNISPQNAFLPAEMLFETNGSRQIQVQGGTIDCYNMNPIVLAEKIDSINTMFIDKLSDWCDWYADKISWKTLKPEYDRLFLEVTNGTI